ncbi:MAG: VCBS repeat-containing protein [Planctomycetota bacterium]
MRTLVTLGVLLTMTLPLSAQSLPLLHEQPVGIVDRYLGVVDLGDVTGDGVSDYALGYEETIVTNLITGWRLISGADGSIVRPIVATPAAFNGVSGVSDVGDMNGDGHADVAYLINSTMFPGNGLSVFVLQDGQTGNPIFSQQIGPSGLGGGALQQVLRIGDLDGDGGDDLVVHYRQVPTLSAPAIVHVIWMNGQTGAQIHELLDYQDIVHSVAVVGDTNGDGLDETLIGAWKSPFVAPEAGGAALVSGANFAYLRFWNGTAAFDHFGTGVKGAGDVDGDGHADLLIVAPVEEKVRIYSGDDDSILASFDLGIGGAYETRLLAVRPFDWNGDGVDDHLFGVQTGIAPMRYQIRSGIDFAVLEYVAWPPVSDLNGDAIPERSDIVTGLGSPPSFTPVPPEARILCHKGAQPYGQGSGGLSLSWQPATGAPATGVFTVSGGTPGAQALVAGSLFPTNEIIAGTTFPLLISPLLNHLFLQALLPLDAQGGLTAPVSLTQPALAGAVLSYQWAELAPNPGTSNGLQLMFDH